MNRDELITILWGLLATVFGTLAIMIWIGAF